MFSVLNYDKEENSFNNVTLLKQVHTVLFVQLSITVLAENVTVVG